MRDDVLDPEDDQGNPDDAETDEARSVERFFVKENADEELNGGRKILQDADHVERNFLRSRGEHEQWNGGHHTGANEQ